MKKNVKSENKKALPLFLIIVALSLVIGGLIGFFAVRAEGANWEQSITAGASNLICSITPWVLIVMAVGLCIYAFAVVKRQKAQIARLQEDDEEGLRRIDHQLSAAIAAVGIIQVVSFFFMAALLVYLDAYFEKGQEILYLAGLLGFIVLLIAEVVATQKLVDLAKKLYPEKRGSVYDIRFQKKWYESCDEAERMLIAEASKSGFQASQAACIALWLVFLLLHMFFHTGLMPILSVSIVWLVSTATYYVKSIQLDHPKAHRQ